MSRRDVRHDAIDCLLHNILTKCTLPIVNPLRFDGIHRPRRDILARRKRRGFLQGKPRVEGGFRTETPQASSVRVSDSACGVLW